jgi:hypothetical protein
MSFNFGTTSSLLTLALSLGLGTATYAKDSTQTEAPQQVQIAESTNPADVSYEDLEKFTNVNVKAQEIEDKYREEVNKAKNMGDIEKVHHKMNVELVDAIHGEDLSIEEYQQVRTDVLQDPELRTRATHMISEKSRKIGN